MDVTQPTNPGKGSRDVVKVKSELKMVLISTVLAIAFVEISVAHTISTFGREGFVEANPLAGFLLGLSPAIAFIFPALIIAELTYASLRFHDYAGMCVSSMLLGATAFDLWTHIYLIL